MKPEEAIARLTQRVYRLEQELAELRQRQGLPPRAEPPPAPPPVPATPPRADAAPAGHRKSVVELEANVVGTWFARAGMLAILIGAGFGFKYAVDRGIIGPGARVAIGIVAGAAFVVWGEVVFRRGWRLFAQAVTGGGVALWYLSILSALHLFELIAPAPAFFALLVATAVTAVLAFRQDAVSLAVLAIVGGFLNPFLVGADRLDPLAFLAYVAALDISVLLLVGTRWNPLHRVALAGTFIVVGTVTPSMSFTERITFATLLFAIFAAVPFVQAVMEQHRRTAGAPDLIIATSGSYFGYVLWVLSDSHEGWRGVFTLSLCAAYALGALAARRLQLHVDARAMVGVAFALVTIFIPVELRGAQIGVAWTIEGLIVLALDGRVFRSPVFRNLSFVLLGIGAFATFAALSSEFPPERLIVTWSSLCVLLVIASLFAAAVDAERTDTADDRAGDVPPYVWAIGANIATLIWLSQELVAEVDRQLISPDQATQFGLTALWGVYAAVVLAVGVGAKLRWARLFSVALFAITVAKLAISDLWLLRTSYRIVAFLGLGAILLACSVMYQRFRDLVLASDEPEAPPAPVRADPPLPSPASPRKKKPAARKPAR